MRFSLQTLFQTILLLTLFLFPGRLTAQEPQGAQSPAAATEQPPAVPELADLIPLATALSGRLASLEKTVAGGVDLSRLEQQLGELSALVDEYARQFLALKASTDPRAGRLPQLKAEIESASDTLAGVSKSVTAKVRTFGNLRKEWLAEQQQWNAWQAALRKDEPLEEITTTVTKAQGAIDTALGLLRQQLKPLLALQEQAGTLQTRINTLTAEVEGLLSLSQGGVLVDASPAMFSAQYFSQLAAALRRASKPGWPRSYGQERRSLPGREGRDPPGGALARAGVRLPPSPAPVGASRALAVCRQTADCRGPPGGRSVLSRIL